MLDTPPSLRPPPGRRHGPDSHADRDEEAALNRHRRLAGLCLLLAVAGWGASHFAPLPSETAALLRAVAEAGMIGGLADWFAVTALFRRPLGLPIPHTALVPANRDRIADGMARYIDREFLEPGMLAEQLRRLDPAARVARLLAAPENRRKATEAVLAVLPSLLSEERDPALRGALLRALRSAAAGADLRVALAGVVRAVVESPEMEVLIQELADRLIHFISTRATLIQETVSRKSPWWVPEFVDSRLAGTVSDGVMAHLYDLRTPHSPAGRDLRRWLSDLADGIEAGNPLGERLLGATRAILDHESFATLVRRAVAHLREAALADLERPDGGLRDAVDTMVGAVAAELDDPALRVRLNATLEEAFVGAMPRWRDHLRGFISATVKAQDAEEFSRRLESRVGKDLQYIRINGTLLGAAIGGALYLLNGWLG